MTANGDPHHDHGVEAMPPAAAALKDPVCGMTVTDRSAYVLQHEGRPVYFCSAGCKLKFAADPARYPLVPAGAAGPSAMPPAAPPGPVVAGAMYTCPMHPEVRQDHPGACPKCGMALDRRCPASTTATARSCWTSSGVFSGPCP